MSTRSDFDEFSDWQLFAVSFLVAFVVVSGFLLVVG